jgi:hypothetical protein
MSSPGLLWPPSNTQRCFRRRWSCPLSMDTMELSVTGHMLLSPSRSILGNSPPKPPKERGQHVSILRNVGFTGDVWHRDGPTIDRLTREKAYYFWEDRLRNGTPGDELGDCLMAKAWVAESFPWLSDRPWWAGTIHLIQFDSDFRCFFCPMCYTFFGEEGNPAPSERFRCSVCGEMLEVRQDAHEAHA